MTILNLKNYCKFIWTVDGLTWGLSMRIVVVEKKGCKKSSKGVDGTCLAGNRPERRCRRFPGERWSMGQNSEPRRDIRRLSLRRSFLVWVACAMLGWVVGLVSLYYVIRTNETITAQDDSSRSDTDAVAESVSPDAAGRPPSVAEIEELRDIAPAAGPGGKATSTPGTLEESGMGKESVAPRSGSELESLDDIAPAAGAGTALPSEESEGTPPISDDQ